MTRLEAIVSALNVARYLLIQEAREHADDLATELEDCSYDLDDMLVRLETKGQLDEQ